MAPAGSAERNEGKAKAAPAGSAERNEGKAKAAPAGSAERNEGKAKAAPAGSAERKANDDSSYYYDDSDSDNAGANAEEEKKPAASVAKAGAGAIKPPAPARDGQDHEDGDGLRSKRAVTHLFLCEVKQSQQACGIRSESPDHKASKSYLKDLTIKLWNSQCWSLIKILKPGLNIFGRFATTSPACTGL